jgi:hypothetical protein
MGVINRTFYMWKITNNKSYTWLRSETYTTFFLKPWRKRLLGILKNIIDMDLDKIGCVLVSWVQLSVNRDRLL